jgi:hypothetical protein
MTVCGYEDGTPNAKSNTGPFVAAENGETREKIRNEEERGEVTHPLIKFKARARYVSYSQLSHTIHFFKYVAWVVKEHRQPSGILSRKTRDCSPSKVIADPSVSSGAQ